MKAKLETYLIMRRKLSSLLTNPRLGLDTYILQLAFRLPLFNFS